MTRRHRFPRLLAVVAVIAAAAAPSGCSDDEQGTATTTRPSSPASVEPAEQDSPGQNSPGHDSPSAHPTGRAGTPRQVGARADLTSFTCAAKRSHWSAKGVVRNDLDDATTYQVRVSVYDPETSTVRGSIEQALTVGARSSERFSFPEIYHASAGEQLRCDARVVRDRA